MLSSSENVRASRQKRLICLVSTLHGIGDCIKNGTIRKTVPPAYGSISRQCRLQLLSERFQNLIHNIFRNENSTLEINVSLFGVLLGSSGSLLHSPLIGIRIIFIRITKHKNNESLFSMLGQPSINLNFFWSFIPKYLTSNLNYDIFDK